MSSLLHPAEVVSDLRPGVDPAAHLREHERLHGVTFVAFTLDELRLIADSLRSTASAVGVNGPAGYRYVEPSERIPAGRLRALATRFDDAQDDREAAGR